MKEKFAAKKGYSFKRFLIAMSLFIIFAGYGLPLLNGILSLHTFMLSSLIVLPVIVLFIWCWSNTEYLVDNNQLKINCGPFHWNIPIADIKRIYLNQGTVGGTIKPTLSWDCMEIEYGNYKTISITPEDQNHFISLLKSQNGKIEVK